MTPSRSAALPPGASPAVPAAPLASSQPVPSPSVPAASAPAVIRATDGRVRPLEAGDLERSAVLFLRAFRRGRRAPSQRAVEEVAAYMRRIYLEGPYCDAGTGTLVQVDGQGDIRGFLGILKTRYRLDDEELSAGIISTLMAADGAHDGMAAPQMLRALNQSAFDMILTDSANRLSLPFARPLKYQLMPLNCLQWMRVFKPAALLLYKARERWPLPPAPLFAPVTHLVDRAAARALRPRQRHAVPPRWREETIDAAGFAAVLPGFVEAYRLRPAWPATELGWLLDQAAQKRAGGDLAFRLVHGGTGTAPIGCYAFYGRRGGPAAVLQLLARPGQWGTVLESLAASAEAMGCIAVHGPANAAMMPDLCAYRGLLFFYGGGTMVRSRREEVLRAVREDKALIGGLAGDRWTRLGTDPFGEG